jgi:hypothetical protein
LPKGKKKRREKAKNNRCYAVGYQDPKPKNAERSVCVSMPMYASSYENAKS